MAFRNVQNEKGWSKYNTLEHHVQPYYDEETRIYKYDFKQTVTESPGPYQEFKRLEEY